MKLIMFLLSAVVVAANLALDKRTIRLAMHELDNQITNIATERGYSFPKMSFSIYGGFWNVVFFGNRDTTGDIDVAWKAIQNPGTQTDIFGEAIRRTAEVNSVFASVPDWQNKSTGAKNQWMNWDFASGAFRIPDPEPNPLSDEPADEFDFVFFDETKEVLEVFDGFGYFTNFDIYFPAWYLQLGLKVRIVSESPLMNWNCKDGYDAIACYLYLRQSRSHSEIRSGVEKHQGNLGHWQSRGYINHERFQMALSQLSNKIAEK